MSDSIPSAVGVHATSLISSSTGYEINSAISPIYKTMIESESSSVENLFRKAFSSVLLENNGIRTEISSYSNLKPSLYNPNRTALSSIAFGIAIFDNPSEQNTSASLMENVVHQALRITTSLYEDILKKCQSIIEASDVDDIEEKEIATLRLMDVLEPLNSVMFEVFRGILYKNLDRTFAVSFLLLEVLPRVDNIRSEIKISIIQSFLAETKPSLRFLAAQALDSMNLNQAKRTLASALDSEPNKEIRVFIETSLSGA